VDRIAALRADPPPVTGEGHQPVELEARDALEHQTREHRDPVASPLELEASDQLRDGAVVCGRCDRPAMSKTRNDPLLAHRAEEALAGPSRSVAGRADARRDQF
jgi:hypothetical protein